MVPVDDEYGFNEHQRTVIARLHKEILRLDSVNASPTFYAALRHSLAALGLSRYPAVLYRVEKRGNEYDVRFRLICGDGWKKSRSPDNHAVIQLWQHGGATRSNQEPGLDLGNIMAAASGFVGQPVCSLVEIPFSHGVLGLYSPEAEAFDQAVVHCVEQLVLLLTVFFRRLDDLTVLAAKECQLRQMQRLQMNSGLMTDIVHELSKPLSILLGESELLLERKLDTEVVAAVRAINRAGLQVRATSDRLFEFVRSIRQEKEWLDFNRLVLDTLELMRHVYTQKRITARHDMGRNIPWVYAHAGQMQQLVLNLLQNASEAVEGHRVQGRVKVQTRSHGRRVILQIEDNGSGVCPKIAHRIFDPFFTTKPNARGGGLGLTVCVGIAREHGGVLQLEPRRMGTCMSLEIPVGQANATDGN